MIPVLNFSDYMIIAVLIGLFGGGSRYAIGRLDPLGKLNARKLDALIKHFNIPAPTISTLGALSPEVRKLAGEGRTLDAIKAYRAETGAGLKEAKIAVDDYLIQTRATASH